MINESLSKMGGATGRVGYAIMRTADNVRRELGVFDKLRINVINKHSGGKNEIKPEDPGWEACLKELNNLLNMEVDCKIHSVSESEWDSDDVYSQDASPVDYELVRSILVDDSAEHDSKAEEGKQ